MIVTNPSDTQIDGSFVGTSPTDCQPCSGATSQQSFGQVDAITLTIEDPEVTDYEFSMPFGGHVYQLTTKTASGSGTATVLIDSVPITGMTSVPLGTSRSTVLSSDLNLFNSGQVIHFRVDASNAMSYLEVTIAYRRDSKVLLDELVAGITGSTIGIGINDLTSSGNITAAQFIGSGAGLTNVPYGSIQSMPAFEPALGNPPTDGYVLASTASGTRSWITSAASWSSLSGKPTTLSGFGITDAQPLDSDLIAIAALATTSFGRGSLVLNDASSFRSYIGAGTSSFNGIFGSLSGVPTTIAGYGITDSLVYTTGSYTDPAWISSLAWSKISGNKVTLTQPATLSTLTILDGKTLTVNNTITLAGTDASTLNIGSGGTLGTNAFSSASFEPALGNPSVNGYVLSSTATGTRSWVVQSGGGGGTPGGSNTQLQYNNSGAFGGISTFTTDGTTLTLTEAPAANTAAAGLTLTDTTAATSGNQQYSPYIYLTGQGWKTTATPGSQSVTFRQGVVPVQGTANPTGQLWIESSINGGAPSNPLKFGSDGVLIVGNASIDQFGSILLTAGSIRATGGFVADYSGVIKVKSTGMFGFSSTTNEQLLPDTALARNAAGVVEVNNGTAGTFRDLLARTLLATTHTASSGTAPAFQATTQTAAASTVAGIGVTLTADPAVAGTTNAGAAAGGTVTITAGNAARLTSGNANGGNISLTTGSGIGTGTAGDVVIPNGTIVGQAAGTNGLTLSNSGSGDRVVLNGSTYIEFKVAGTQQGYFTSGIGGFTLGTGIRWVNDNASDIGTATVRLRDIYVGRSILASSGSTTDTGQSRSAAGIWELNSGTAGKYGQLKSGTVALQSLASPTTTITISNQGTTGSTSYTYKYTFEQADGTSTDAGGSATTATGNATLNGTNFNRLTLPALPTNATRIGIWRTASGGTPSTTGKIGTATTTTFDDTGLAGDATTAPTVNNTGLLVQSGWTNATLLNSWANAAGTAAYMKDSMGFVHLKGLISGGTTTAATTLFTLPAGFRPLEGQYFRGVNNNQINIDTSGNVNLDTTASGSVSFSGVTFSTF